jgi:5-methyltetrahydropteroyltriglutamate--homocysteine methyltransferase
MSLPDLARRRILTTHTGSLPRPDGLSELLVRKLLDEAHDPAELAAATRTAVAGIVRQQLDCGIDVINDGEQSKASFQIYATERLAGIEPRTPEAGFYRTRENLAHPAFYPKGEHSGSQRKRWACTGPIEYTGQTIVAADLDNLKAALAGHSPADVFVPSVSPSSCAGLMENRHYATDEEHVLAVAEALRIEYEAIVAAGFMLQIDDPRLAMHYMLSPDESVADARRWAAGRIEILNHALRNIPRERVRHHTCYGINQGPRTTDLEMRHLVDLIVTIKASYYSFEAANPRHEHEWSVWRDVPLPEGAVLMPGVITHASSIVEHPELVAQRLIRFAGIVGRERVMASSDCGFASTLARGVPPEIEPSVVWSKLKSLTEGARIASSELF